MSGLQVGDLTPVVNAAANSVTAIVALMAARSLKGVVMELRQVQRDFNNRRRKSEE